MNQDYGMTTDKVIHKDIDAYISRFSEETQNMLQEVRTAVRGAAPTAEEKISYQMPTFFQNGNLVHFAAFKNHIGFYGVPTGDSEFREELSAFQEGKGSLRFPIGKPVPVGLIAKIVRCRVKLNLQKAEAKVKSARTARK